MKRIWTILLLLLTLSLASLFTGCAVTGVTRERVDRIPAKKGLAHRKPHQGVAPGQGAKKAVYHENIAGGLSNITDAKRGPSSAKSLAWFGSGG